MRLNGKLALITGGASGIGEAGAKLFAAEGASVVIVDNDQASLDRVVGEIKQAGGKADGFTVDLSDLNKAVPTIDEAASRLGGLDIVWFNAGITGPGDVYQLDADAYQRTIAINQSSPILATGAAVAHMRKRGGGSIVITSSTSGIVGAVSSPVYSASKFAVVGWAKSAAQRLAPDKIRINCLCPGPTATPLMLRACREGTGGYTGEEYQQRMLSAVPLGRMAEPVEQAYAALWLSSDESLFVTGITLPVDGGYTAR
jgi:NAD(P)-dependent dehydrogenase (short-subunit alcohol dehydrogenase family)